MYHVRTTNQRKLSCHYSAIKFAKWFFNEQLNEYMEPSLVLVQTEITFLRNLAINKSVLFDLINSSYRNQLKEIIEKFIYVHRYLSQHHSCTDITTLFNNIKITIKLHVP